MDDDDELWKWHKEVLGDLYDIKARLQHLYYVMVALLCTVGGIAWGLYFR